MIELLSFSILGTLWFWVAVVVLILAIWGMCVEAYLPPAFGIVIGCVILNYFGEIPILTFIKENPLDIVIYITGYVVIGVVWGLVKWFLFVQKKKREFPKFKNKFIADVLDDRRNSIVTHLTEDDLAQMKRGHLIAKLHKELNVQAKIHDFPPNAENNKEKIITWMLYWVLSMVGTLLGDLVKEVYEYLYSLIGKSFDRISKYIFKDFSELN